VQVHFPHLKISTLTTACNPIARITYTVLVETLNHAQSKRACNLRYDTIEEFNVDPKADLEPVQRSEDRCDKRRFRGFNHSTCKTVLNLLEAVYLRLRKIVVERVTVVNCQV